MRLHIHLSHDVMRRYEDEAASEQIDGAIRRLLPKLEAALPGVSIDVYGPEDGDYRFTPSGDAPEEACEDCEGAGWAHFDEPRSIQRCDSCKALADDAQAAVRHSIECGCSWEPQQPPKMMMVPLPGPVPEAFRETCYACEAHWGECTCVPDAKGFLFEGVRILEPNASTCGRFFVEPSIYYGEAFAEWRLERATAAGEEALWAAVAKHYPEIKTGDVDPGLAYWFGECAADAVRRWVDFNEPESPAKPASLPDNIVAAEWTGAAGRFTPGQRVYVWSLAGGDEPCSYVPRKIWVADSPSMDNGDHCFASDVRRAMR